VKLEGKRADVKGCGGIWQNVEATPRYICSDIQVTAGSLKKSNLNAGIIRVKSSPK
jgi:hypothetical protein